MTATRDPVGSHDDAELRDVLTVVSPSSLESWYGEFCGELTDVMFIGEADEDPAQLAERVFDWARGREVRILSSHESLTRDWVLAHELRSRGVTVHGQSGMASSAAVDKVLQKKLFSFANIPTPIWGKRGSRPDPGVASLWKGRTSTQSRDIAWYDPASNPPPESYWEKYVEGIEYSIVLYRGSGRTVRFPAVWKGPVSADLSPPWRRLRLVPSGASEVLLADLDSVAVRIAELFDIRGFGEVEFIVGVDQLPLVTEVNPRISGTMRIAAMASGLQIFDPESFRTLDRPIAINYSAEIPYMGPPLTTRRLVATSRLTCAGATPSEVFDELRKHGFGCEPASLPEVWRAD